MPITTEHYQLIRRHFFNILGGKCQSYQCDFNNYDKIHFHHKNGSHLINGEKNGGRGRENRLWELFKAFQENNLMLLCPKHHSQTEDYKGRKNKL